MNAKTILVPIDIAACPLELFRVINQFADQEDLVVKLLYVSKLSVVCPENRLYTEVARESEATLEKLQSKLINPRLRTEVFARIGRPASEIVASAGEFGADLIVLTSRAGRRRRHFFEVDIVENVVRTAPCPVRILRVHSSVDFTAQFGHATKAVAAFEFAEPSWRPGNVHAPIHT